MHYRGSHLYWCDAFLDKIERSDLRGNNRELVLNTTNLLQIHPFDLAVYQDNVYWTDWRYTAVIRVHVNGRGLDIFSPALLQLAGGIHIQEEPDFCDSSPCNHGETCMDVVNGFTCLCPSGSPACSSSGGTTICVFILKKMPMFQNK
ncbi:low-density lipoprotein receptor-related protein 2-like [Patiria miniata]|uniref:EGF-like domain-containing protein n=1 Tax=Patiria miniata TaxID=46514 RepID=A0A914BFW2_PATMI|nr:low-density lipoprotein receptor-related protein 2-like [Patiria miniata]